MSAKIENHSPDIWEGEVMLDMLSVDTVFAALVAMTESSPEWAKMTICDCAAKGRFDLLESAAKIIRREPKELAMHVARIVASGLTERPADPNTYDDNLCIFPAKGDVLLVMEKWVPGLYRFVPKNKGERAKWWLRAELDHLPRIAGTAASVPKPVRYAIQKIEAERLKKIQSDKVLKVP
jgi:hypothetical protein